MRETDDSSKSATTPESSSVTSQRVSELVHQIEVYRAELSEQRQSLEQARSQLRDAFARYNELYQMVPVGFLTLDRQARIRELNEKAARILAFPSGWLVGRPFLVFVARPDVQRFLNFLHQSLQKPEQNSIDLDLSVDGRTIAVQLSMRTSFAADRLVHRLTILDLSDVKKVEGELQDSLENWHSLVHNAPEIIMTIDRTGKITFVNRPVWGYSVNALLGSQLMQYVAPKYHSKMRQCIEQAFRSSRRAECEINGVNGDKESWFSFSFNSGNSGPKAAWKTATVMVREISEHKRAEQTLRLSGERLREFAARAEAVREEERARVAREIHDDLGQALTILKLDLSWVQSRMPRGQTETRKKMKGILQHVDETIDRVRRIASELRPSILDDLGLSAAIEWQLREFQKRTSIKCRFRSNAEKLDLTPEATAAIFRVIQEALTNIMRHAKASSVQIDLESKQKLLVISIADDGVGMSVEKLNNLVSLGIVGMTERVSRIGGHLSIQSRPGKGMRLEVFLPIRK